MTVPPPPAVPGELIRRVDALAAVIRRVDPRHDLGAGALAEALLPFIGDIVEAERRDALSTIERCDDRAPNLGGPSVPPQFCVRPKGHGGWHEVPQHGSPSMRWINK